MVYYAIVSQLENFFNLLLCVCVWKSFVSTSVHVTQFLKLLIRI